MCEAVENVDSVIGRRIETVRSWPENSAQSRHPIGRYRNAGLQDLVSTTVEDQAPCCCKHDSAANQVEVVLVSSVGRCSRYKIDMDRGGSIRG